MCGISGILALDDNPVDQTALERMRETLVHRGPDSAGMVVSGPAGLAMQRLAIIDILGGQQPLSSEDGQIHLVCNGEIYNYRELRLKLQATGHRFQTGSDCEVIVHAYEAYGDDFPAHLNGMFALALWDNRRRRLILARDRVGIKPLYYAQHRQQLLFASEPKALLAYPGFERKLDPISLYQYLTYEYVPTPRSMYSGIHKIRPGHLLIVERGEIREQAYWQLDLSPHTDVATASESELAQQLWTTLREAVQLELVSDVPLGIFLSGGIDSSAIALAASELEPKAVRTFTIGFGDPSFDESACARHVADFLGTQHSELILEPRMLWELLPTIAALVDEPLADASILPTYLLSRFTRDQVTVALGGDGGDELFAGYPSMQAHRLAAIYRHVPAWMRTELIAPIVGSLPVSLDNMSLDFLAKRFISGTDRSIPERHHLWLGAYSPQQKQHLLAPEVLDQVGSTDTFDVLCEHIARSAMYDDLSKVLYMDMKMYLEGDILVKVDRASMACSLEVRVPLLNTVMLDFAARLPIGLKLHGFTRKYLLRKALRGRLPDRVINRPKQGFGIPVSKWLCGELRDLLFDLLGHERVRNQGIFNAMYVSRMIDEHVTGRQDNRKPLWTLLMFQLWYQQFIEHNDSSMVGTMAREVRAQ